MYRFFVHFWVKIVNRKGNHWEFVKPGTSNFVSSFQSPYTSWTIQPCSTGLLVFQLLLHFGGGNAKQYHRFLTLPLADTSKSLECYLLLELLVNHGKCQCYTMRPVVAVCITREHSSFQVWILPNCNTLVSAQHFLLYISNCLTHGIHMFRQPLHFQMCKIAHFLKKEVGVLGRARKCLLQYFPSWSTGSSASRFFKLLNTTSSVSRCNYVVAWKGWDA